MGKATVRSKPLTPGARDLFFQRGGRVGCWIGILCSVLFEGTMSPPHVLPGYHLRSPRANVTIGALGLAPSTEPYGSTTTLAPRSFT
jgi:hypothetical protein